MGVKEEYTISYIGTRGHKEISVTRHEFPEVMDAYEELQEAGIISSLKVDNKSLTEFYKEAKLH